MDDSEGCGSTKKPRPGVRRLTGFSFRRRRLLSTWKILEPGIQAGNFSFFLEINPGEKPAPIGNRTTPR
jgi:hypothetical protein